MRPESIRLQTRLADLLATADADPRVRNEMMEARREFFGNDQPDYVDATDGRALDAAAQRFAEWFVLERPSAVLGGVPLSVLGSASSDDATLARSRVGLFLVEASGAELRVRDLEGGEPLVLADPGVRLAPGDVLVGRLFPLDDEFLPSAALAILGGSPHLAVAFQRDMRQLGLDRRLSQAEIEHLVFRRQELQQHLLGESEGQPIERIEAELQTLLDAAGVTGDPQITAISEALRQGGDRPGPVIEPLMDRLAFDTEVDLDKLRELLLTLSNAHRLAAARRAAAPAPPTPRVPPVAPAEGSEFRPRRGEKLGEQLARRIEEGLASSEDVGALFADVERMFGESIDDDEEDERGAGPSQSDDGDLEPLIREFAWETSATTEDEVRLAELVAQQKAVPVPRTNVEYLEPDDYLRYLLQIWLGASPPTRAENVRAAFDLLTRFHDWMVETQDVDLRSRLEGVRRVLVEPLDDLQAASIALSQGDFVRPDDAERVTLLRVVGRTAAELMLESDDGSPPRRVAADPDSTARIAEGDLVLGVLDPTGDARGRFVGPAVVVPMEAEHLLG